MAVTTDKALALAMFKNTLGRLDAVHAAHFGDSPSVRCAIADERYSQVHRESARLTLEQAESFMRTHFPGAQTFDDVLHLAPIIAETGLWPGPITSAARACRDDTKSVPPVEKKAAPLCLEKRADVTGPAHVGILTAKGEEICGISPTMVTLIMKALRDGRSLFSVERPPGQSSRPRACARVITRVDRMPTDSYMKPADFPADLDVAVIFKKIFEVLKHSKGLDYMEFDVSVKGSVSVELPYSVGSNVLYYELNGLHYYMYENAVTISPKSMSDIPSYYSKTYRGQGVMNFKEMADYRYGTIGRTPLHAGMIYLRALMRCRDRLDMAKATCGITDGIFFVKAPINGRGFITIQYDAGNRRHLVRCTDMKDVAVGQLMQFSSEIVLDVVLTNACAHEWKDAREPASVLLAILRNSSGQSGSAGTSDNFYISCPPGPPGPAGASRDLRTSRPPGIPGDPGHVGAAGPTGLETKRLPEVKVVPEVKALAVPEVKVVSEPADKEFEFMQSFANDQISLARKCPSSAMRAIVMRNVARMLEDYAAQLDKKSA